jgi:hypothetical protein
VGGRLSVLSFNFIFESRRWSRPDICGWTLSAQFGKSDILMSYGDKGVFFFFLNIRSSIGLYRTRNIIKIFVLHGSASLVLHSGWACFKLMEESPFWNIERNTTGKDAGEKGGRRLWASKRILGYSKITENCFGFWVLYFYIFFSFFQRFACK